jgi:hypothetical protein
MTKLSTLNAFVLDDNMQRIKTSVPKEFYQPFLNVNADDWHIFTEYVNEDSASQIKREELIYEKI